MVYQLWLLVVSLGLDNPPRTGLTLVKSRIKMIRRREQGNTVKCDTVCHNGNSPLAIRSQILLLIVAIRGTVIFFVAIRGLNTAVCHELW
jgi:hypothetical protein